MKWWFIFLSLFLAVSLGFIFTSCLKEAKCDCAADTVKIAKIFRPDGAFGKDAIIENITPDLNLGDVPYFTVFSWTKGGQFDTARALIAFDLSVFPAQTTIKSARLSLYWIPYDNLIEHTGDNTFSIYRIIEDWDENTVTWNNQPSVSDVNKVVVRKSITTNQSYIDTDVTNLVQDIINNPTEGHGFMLKLDQEFPYKLVILASSDYSDINKRPKLVVYY